MLLRAAAILAAGCVLGAVANAVSPRGLSWTRPLGDGLRARAARAGLVPIGLEQVRRLPPDVLLLDSRPPEEFAVGRLPGAVSVPEGKAVSAPPGRPIVVYCANEFCESSLRLGERLLAAGHRNVALFVEGYEAWWNAGGPVDED
jgi:ArsR family transcriptional regulator